MGNAERAHKINFRESGRGVGRVTPTIFGSTVGFDSLASCYLRDAILARVLRQHCRRIVDRYPSVCPSRAGIVSERTKLES